MASECFNWSGEKHSVVMQRAGDQPANLLSLAAEVWRHEPGYGQTAQSRLKRERPT